jgi:hypothetical protein
MTGRKPSDDDFGGCKLLNFTFQRPGNMNKLDDDNRFLHINICRAIYVRESRK